MTTPTERTRALVWAGDFLEELRNAEPGTVPDALREQANRILRHYPATMEIEQMARMERPDFSFGQMLSVEGIPENAPKGYRR